MPTLSQYSQHLALLFPAVRTSDFPQRLVAMLQDLVPCQDATIIFFPETELPVIEYFDIPEEGGKSTLDLFVKGAFLLDPYYLAATREHKYGVFRLRDLAPTGFKDSEYYRAWYRNCSTSAPCPATRSAAACM